MNISLKHFIKHIFKDSIKNWIQSVKSIIRLITYKPGKVRLVEPPANYKLIFNDDFKGQLNTNTWRLGQAWGDFHPGHLHQYYDTSGEMVYTTNDGLSLDLKNKPKHYIKSELPDWRRANELPDEFTIPTGIGLVTTIDSWQYGWFEGWIKLPKGQSYWNAFWLSGVNNWPPEIDIFEGYSEVGNKYDKYLIFNKLFKVSNWKIQPNIHYGRHTEGTKDNYISFNSPVADVTERFVQYVCHWEKDFIRIYYDGLLILECTDQNILKWFNGSDDKMNIIINHGLHSSKPENPDESTMIVKSIKIYQK